MNAIPMTDELRVGVFVCECGMNIAGAVDCAAVTEYAQTLLQQVLVWQIGCRMMHGLMLHTHGERMIDLFLAQQRPYAPQRETEQQWCDRGGWWKP